VITLYQPIIHSSVNVLSYQCFIFNAVVAGTVILMLPNDVSSEFNKSYNIGHFVVGIVFRDWYLLKN
jgi:hypothetical protein